MMGRVGHGARLTGHEDLIGLGGVAWTVRSNIRCVRWAQVLSWATGLVGAGAAGATTEFGGSAELARRVANADVMRV